LPSETDAGVTPGAGVAAGADDELGAGTAKGVDCGNGVDCGGGVGLDEGAPDGVFVGAGDCVVGVAWVAGRVEVGGGVCARGYAPKHDNAASADSKRTPAFDGFRIVSFETGEYTHVYINGRLKRR
jgi:hypothetical protein